MAEAQPKEEEKPVEEEEVEEYQKCWDAIVNETNSLIETFESFSERTFHDSPTYKQRQGLEKSDPGKRDFGSIPTQIRRLKEGMKRKYNEVKPRDTAPRKTSNKTGFNRLVLVDKPLRDFMKLADWGLVGEVDPDRVGVCTHAIVTRGISNYVNLKQLTNPLKPATWSADAILRELFADDWKECGVNPQEVRYTGLQKLIARHITSVKEGTSEHRSEEHYRKKLDDEGEFGKATREIRDLRKELVDLSDSMVKRSDHLKTARDDCPALAGQYEASLKELIAAFDAKAAEIRKKCEEYDFPISATYPSRPRTVLDVK